MSRRRKRTRVWGDGTAYLRRDGRWMAQVFVTESVTGRRVRRALYGKTEDEVEDKMRELRDQERQGIPIAPATLTVESYLRDWLSQIVAVRVRANTLAHYKFQIDKGAALLKGPQAALGMEPSR